MMQLPFIIETVGRMWVLSGVLLLIYTLLARRKADYRACRRLLMAVPLCCLAVPVLQFAGGKLSELREPQQIELTQAQAEEYIRKAPARYILTTDAPWPDRLIEARKKDTDYGHAARMAARAVPTVSAVLLALMGLQWIFVGLRCRRMTRRGTLSADGVVRSAGVDTPFSFGRRIFLPQTGLTDEGERLIVMHERAHIALRHAREGLLMEAFCRLLWFNPFMWMARKELRDVQEFEADRHVLDAGTEVGGACLPNPAARNRDEGQSGAHRRLQPLVRAAALCGNENRRPAQVFRKMEEHGRSVGGGHDGTGFGRSGSRSGGLENCEYRCAGSGTD